jgi:putative NADH-flavin reductase
MKLLILGATGRTGRHVVTQSLDRGHDVRALVRSPQKLTGDPRIDVRAGSVTDPAAVEAALDGRDSVVSALGSRRAMELLGTHFMTDTMRALVPAMDRGRVRRLVVLSAVGVGETESQAPAMIRLGFRTLLRGIARDKERAEAQVRESGLDWTIVYPPALTNGPLTKTCRFGEDLMLKGSAKVSRADVAHFMLDQLDDAVFSRKNVVVAST